MPSQELSFYSVTDWRNKSVVDETRVMTRVLQNWFRFIWTKNKRLSLSGFTVDIKTALKEKERQFKEREHVEKWKGNEKKKERNRYTLDECLRQLRRMSSKAISKRELLFLFLTICPSSIIFIDYDQLPYFCAEGYMFVASSELLMFSRACVGGCMNSFMQLFLDV